MPTFRFAVEAGLVLAALQAQSALADERSAPEKVSFYLAAHEDDWQLFMNPTAFEDVANSKTRTIFIHTTAGDAGLGTGTGGRKHPYYLARENGAQAAIRFMADAAAQPLVRKAALRPFNGHPIYRVSYRNTASYFLRLPDGNPSGSGYRSTGNQSLAALAGGRMTTLAAIDGSTVYHGWNDLVSTLRVIMDYERGHAPSVQLNVAELDQSINPGDHSDHRMTAKAALDAMADVSCARRVFYIDYASSKLPENLTAQSRDMESSVLAVTAAAIVAFDHASIWAPYHRGYLGRNYFRVEEGSGVCQDPVPVAHTVADRKPKR